MKIKSSFDRGPRDERGGGREEDEKEESVAPRRRCKSERRSRSRTRISLARRRVAFKTVPERKTACIIIVIAFGRLEFIRTTAIPRYRRDNASFTGRLRALCSCAAATHARRRYGGSLSSGQQPLRGPVYGVTSILRYGMLHRRRTYLGGTLPCRPTTPALSRHRDAFLPRGIS